MKSEELPKERTNMNGDIPAYPTQYLNEHSGNVESSGGLTKREAFAMAAMQGLCGEYQTSESHSNDIAERVAKRAVRLADELLKQLEHGSK